MVRLLIIATIAGFACAPCAHAGKYNPVLSIGDDAPSWTNLPGIDGKQHALADLKDASAIVLVFTCNSCPYAIDYEARIMALTKEFRVHNVAVVAVNVNTIPADNLEAMQARAKSQGFNFPYLFDASQQIAKDYGATYTPEFFVLDQQRKIAYMGALDDNPVADRVGTRHVAAALNAVLANKPLALAETIAIGCRIRMDRPRRTSQH